MDYYGIDITIDKYSLSKLIQKSSDCFEIAPLTNNKFFYKDLKLNCYDITDKYMYALKNIDFYNIFNDYKGTSNISLSIQSFLEQSYKDSIISIFLKHGVEPKYLVEKSISELVYYIFSEYNNKNLNLLDSNIGKNILVINFDDEVFDMSIINISNEDDKFNVKIIETTKNTKISGNLIDIILIKNILNILLLNYMNDSFINDVVSVYENYYDRFLEKGIIYFDDSVDINIKKFIYNIKRCIEYNKIRLSTKNDDIKFTFDERYKSIILSRKSFEEYIISGDELNIYENIEDEFYYINPKVNKLGGILLTGKCFEIPIIQTIILEKLKEYGYPEKLIHIQNDIENSVSKGVTIYSALMDGIAIPPFKHDVCDNIILRDIEIEHLGNRNIFIEAGTEYPFEMKKSIALKIGHSLSDYIPIKINEIIKKNNIIDRREICNLKFNLPVYYTGDDITVYIDIDEFGMYEIEVVHNDTKESSIFKSKKRYSLSEGELTPVIKL